MSQVENIVPENSVNSPNSPNSPNSANSEKEETVFIEERERYYQDQLGKLSLLILLAGGVIFLLLVLNFLLFQETVPPPTYFAATDQGQILQELPLDKSNVATNELLAWVIDAMMDSHTFNFMNYSRIVDEAKQYFTTEGYTNYLTGLSRSGITERIKRDKLVVVSSPSQAPEILKEGPYKSGNFNRYLWKIRVPLSFNFRSVSVHTGDQAEAMILVMRVPTTVSPTGLSILQYALTIKAPGQELNLNQ